MLLALSVSPSVEPLRNLWIVEGATEVNQNIHQTVHVVSADTVAVNAHCLRRGGDLECAAAGILVVSGGAGVPVGEGGGDPLEDVPNWQLL